MERRGGYHLHGCGVPLAVHHGNACQHLSGHPVAPQGQGRVSRVEIQPQVKGHAIQGEPQAAGAVLF